MCKLMVIDEDGNQVKSKNCEVRSYSLSVNEKNKLTLKITQGNGKIQSYSGVVNAFSDATCSVFKVDNCSYVICD